MTPSVSPVEPGAPVGGLSGVRERLIEAGAQTAFAVPLAECHPEDAEAMRENMREILAAVLPLIADEIERKADPLVHGGNCEDDVLRRAAALVRSFAADGAR